MALMDRIAQLAIRHDKAVAIFGAIWFWAGIAIYARFIELPDMPEIVRQGFFWLGVAFNATWWGFAKPALDRRKQALLANEDGAAK